MFDRVFEKIFSFCGRHLRLVMVLIVAAIIYSICSLPGIKFDNNIEVMLPKDRDLQGQLKFLQSGVFSGKIALSLGISDDAHSLPELLAYADKVKEELKSPLISGVDKAVVMNKAGEDVIDYLQYMPQFAGEAELAKIKDALSTADIRQRVRNIWASAARAESIFLLPVNRLDPFGLSGPLLKRLTNATNAFGYRFAFEGGHIVSEDKRNVMMVIDTPVKATDGKQAKLLLAYLDNLLARRPDFITARIICAHRHAVNNEAVIKQDISRTCLIAALVFLLVLFFAYKDIRAGIFFIIPLVAVIVATKVTSLFFGTLSYFIVAMGGVIVGIADDYGIHIYTAVRSGGKKIVAHTAWPLTVAIAVTVCVFAGFFVSSIPGYHQFAFFAIVSILLCVLFVLFVFPHLITDKESAFNVGGAPGQEKITREQDINIIRFWIFVLILFIGLGMRANFNNDINNFDGSGTQVIKDEKNFDMVWARGGVPAMLVIPADDLKSGLTLSAAAAKEIAAVAGTGQVTALSDIWPPQETRRENLLHWQEFWKKQDLTRIKREFTAGAEKNGFKRDMFAPFFQLIDNPAAVGDEKIELFGALKERFVQYTNDKVQMIVYMPDQPRPLAAAYKTASKIPEAIVISRANFSYRLGYVLSTEIKRLTVASLILILCVSFLLLRNIRLAVISLASLITALAAVAAGFVIGGRALNAPALIASIVVTGLSLDYGILMLYGLKGSHVDITQKAMWVSASTTLIGAATLLFAKHPLLYSIGLALTWGLSAGFITAQFVVGALYRLWVVKKYE